MKTSRQMTAEILQQEAALESHRDASERELQAALAADAAVKAAIEAPGRAARAATIAASHQADAEFLAWKARQG